MNEAEKRAFLSSEKNCSGSSENVRRTRASRSVGGEAGRERNRGNAVLEKQSAASVHIQIFVTVVFTSRLRGHFRGGVEK